MATSDETKLLNLIADIRELREEAERGAANITRFETELENERDDLEAVKASIKVRQEELDDLIAEMTGEEEEPTKIYTSAWLGD